MDKEEATELLAAEVSHRRAQNYAQLTQLIGDEQHQEVIGGSGTEYQVEVQAWWDDRQERNLRVIVSIDDGGLRAIVPMTDSFIIAPDGTFVGEKTS